MTESNIISIKVLSTGTLVDEFREQCLSGTSVKCSYRFMHDKWLVTKKLSAIWWDLRREERESVADFVIRNTLFFPIKYYRAGSLGCKGGEGDYKRAVCAHNAVIRFVRFGNGENYYDDISSCYWRRGMDYAEHCYYEESFGLPVYLCLVETRNFAHGIVALQIGEDMRDFNNWRFFQWKNSNIRPGDDQMPCTYRGYNMVVSILQISRGLYCYGCSFSKLVNWKLDSDCNVHTLSYSPYTLPVYIETPATLNSFINDPALNVAFYFISSEEIVLLVSEFTDANRKLDGKIIDGKVVRVKKVLR